MIPNEINPKVYRSRLNNEFIRSIETELGPYTTIHQLCGNGNHYDYNVPISNGRYITIPMQDFPIVFSYCPSYSNLHGTQNKMDEALRLAISHHSTMAARHIEKFVFEIFEQHKNQFQCFGKKLLIIGKKQRNLLALWDYYQQLMYNQYMVMVDRDFYELLFKMYSPLSSYGDANPWSKTLTHTGLNPKISKNINIRPPKSCYEFYVVDPEKFIISMDPYTTIYEFVSSMEIRYEFHLKIGAYLVEPSHVHKGVIHHFYR